MSLQVNRVVITLAASSDKRNIMVWRPSVRPSVRVSVRLLSLLFLTLIERAAHTQRDSPETVCDTASVRRPDSTCYSIRFNNIPKL